MWKMRGKYPLFHEIDKQNFSKRVFSFDKFRFIVVSKARSCYVFTWWDRSNNCILRFIKFISIVTKAQSPIRNLRKIWNFENILRIRISMKRRKMSFVLIFVWNIKTFVKLSRISNIEVDSCINILWNYVHFQK